MSNWNQQPPADEPKSRLRRPRKMGLLGDWSQQNVREQPKPVERAPDPRVGGADALHDHGQSDSNRSQLPARSSVPPSTPGLVARVRPQPAPSDALLPVPSPAPPLPPYQQRLSPPAHNIVTNSLQAMRDWSGKVAAVAGYHPDPVAPPAPPLELYRPHVGMPATAAGHVRPQKPRRWRRSRATRVVRHMRNRRERWQSRGVTVGRVWIGILLALLFLVVVTSASGTAYGVSYYQSQLPKLQGLAKSNITQTTRIYDRNYQLLSEYYDTTSGSGGRRTPVTYKDLPQVLQDAQIAAEDATFWTNAGVDPTGIVRSASSGVGGGSTITQQVVKNLSKDSSYSLNRKITEAALAIGLTNQYSKPTILTMYFNVAPYGSQDEGVEAAVEEYFGLRFSCNFGGKFDCSLGVSRLDWGSPTDPHDPQLALARASLLAGMPQKPVSDDPTLGTKEHDAAIARQTYVLQQMQKAGDIEAGIGPITDTVIQKVHNLTETFNFTRYQPPLKARSFVDYIKTQVETALGNGDANEGVNAFLTGGFNIRTTLDSNLETYVESAVTRHITQPEYQQFPYGHTATLNADYNPQTGQYGNNVHDASVVVENSKTGEILALDGSASYDDADLRVAGQVDIATDGIGRQPGSTFKPIVYSTAFQMGWYPGIVLPDAQTYFPNGLSAGAPVPLTKNQIENPDVYCQGCAYRPGDYGGQYHTNLQPMTIRLATANSFNVPAVKAIQYTGIDNVVTTAERMGISAISDKVAACAQKNQSADQCLGSSLVLGTTEIPLIQMVGAYQTFSNQGKHMQQQGILDVWDNYGHNLFHFDPTSAQGDQVLSPQVAFMETSILEDEASRAFEFTGDHDLSFYDKSPLCGAANYLLCPYQVAAKTGTTDKFVDNLTLGYNSNVTVGVWAGNANREPMYNVVGITGAAPIWHSVMEYANGWCNTNANGYGYVGGDKVPCPANTLGLPAPGQFTQPAGLIRQCVNAQNGLAGFSNDCDFMLPNEAPQQSGLAPTSNNNNNGQ